MAGPWEHFLPDARRPEQQEARDGFLTVSPEHSAFKRKRYFSLTYCLDVLFWMAGQGGTGDILRRRKARDWRTPPPLERGKRSRQSVQETLPGALRHSRLSS